MEARVKHAETQAEGLMATLFDIPPAEQQAALARLKFLRARMEHDYWEYKLGAGLGAGCGKGGRGKGEEAQGAGSGRWEGRREGARGGQASGWVVCECFADSPVPVSLGPCWGSVPSMQMEPFRRRLETSINYIDMHIEMCMEDSQQSDINRTVTDLEQKFFTLLSDVDVRGTGFGRALGRGESRRPQRAFSHALHGFAHTHHGVTHRPLCLLRHTGDRSGGQGGGATREEARGRPDPRRRRDRAPVGEEGGHHPARVAAGVQHRGPAAPVRSTEEYPKEGRKGSGC